MAGGESWAKKIYAGVWDVLAGVFHVPKEPPSLPVEAGRSVASFRPAPGFLRYLKFYFWFLLALIDGLLTALWIGTVVMAPIVGILLAPIFLVVAVLPDVFAYVALHLRCDTTWYVLSDRSLRIRRGIWTIRETTITFENVQNVAVKQGPLERHFGIANVIVETAGGGGTSSQGGEIGPHVGLIEGVDSAPQIRDMIMTRVRRSRVAGLGDEDRVPEHGEGWSGVPWSADHVELLGAIRGEIVRFRQSEGRERVS